RGLQSDVAAVAVRDDILTCFGVVLLQPSEMRRKVFSSRYAGLYAVVRGRPIKWLNEDIVAKLNFQCAAEGGVWLRPRRRRSKCSMDQRYDNLHAHGLPQRQFQSAL